MKYQHTLIVLGVLVILLPLVHFPFSWELIIHIVIGLLIVITAAVIDQNRRKNRPTTPPSAASKEVAATPAVETLPETDIEKVDEMTEDRSGPVVETMDETKLNEK